MKKQSMYQFASRVTMMVTVFAVLFTIMLWAGDTLNLLYASESNQSNGVIRSEPVMPFVFNGDLRELPKVQPWRSQDPVYNINPRINWSSKTDVNLESRVVRQADEWQDSLLRLQQDVLNSVSSKAFTTPALNFAGQGFTGVMPPDTVGDAGPNHYIQMVNNSESSIYTVYDKSGTKVAGPSLLQDLGTGSGNCASGRGDPIVLYDRLAERWLMAEFAESGNHLCVYISQTPDPVTGGWFLYDFTTPNFPDYPKYGVWPDAYYVSSNESAPAAYALDRAQMLAGAAATSQRFTATPLAGFPFQALIPSDHDGASTPPVSAPNYFMRHRDDEVHNASPNPTKDFLEIWAFHVDWTTPANSTFTKIADIEVSEFDSDLCGLSSFECFPQPDTTQTLDPVREVIMWRLQYINFGSHETLVGNLTTDVDGTDHGGIRWFELRKTGSAWTLHQEGTFAPDSAHRWMGSIAMDKDGNIALGYSVSSSSVFPSIRYTGRLASDPSGTMTQGETTITNGAFAQTASSRWGDYSAMSLDPADDCTFWYTNEYVGSGGNWQTQIASFKFDSCSPSAVTANFSGTPTSGAAPLTVNFTDSSTSSGTITSWSWNFGDGGTSTEQNPTYEYSSAGTYTVSLTVSDDTNSDTETKTNYITVGSLPVTANFSGTPTSGAAPLTVNFTDSSTSSGTITSWSWNFGDGGTSTEQNPTYEYSSAGTYTVSLTVSDGTNSDTETKTNYITVEGVQQPGFTLKQGSLTTLNEDSEIEDLVVKEKLSIMITEAQDLATASDELIAGSVFRVAVETNGETIYDEEIDGTEFTEKGSNLVYKVDSTNYTLTPLKGKIKISDIGFDLFNKTQNPENPITVIVEVGAYRYEISPDTWIIKPTKKIVKAKVSNVTK